MYINVFMVTSQDTKGCTGTAFFFGFTVLIYLLLSEGVKIAKPCTEVKSSLYLVQIYSCNKSK